jgi:hypothetical protein
MLCQWHVSQWHACQCNAFLHDSPDSPLHCHFQDCMYLGNNPEGLMEGQEDKAPRVHLRDDNATLLATYNAITVPKLHADLPATLGTIQDRSFLPSLCRSLEVASEP